MTEVRYRVGIDTETLQREAIDSVRREQAHLASTGHRGGLPPALFLAVSGGGDDRGFGRSAGARPDASLVNRSKQRPERDAHSRVSSTLGAATALRGHAV
jgi:hypothetical protein